MGLVRSKKFAQAVQHYEAALAAAAPGQEAMRAALYANISLCYLQQQLYRRAVDAATHSIEHDASNAKAYYRRCLAYRALKMYAEARRDMEALRFCRHEMSAAEMDKLQKSLALAGASDAAGQ